MGYDPKTGQELWSCQGIPDGYVCPSAIAHDGNPVLAWNIGNVVGHFDPRGNVYPRKERPENKIDAAIASIMALGTAIFDQAGAASIYEEKELLLL